MKEINHVAFIMDGNRRYAKKQGKSSHFGHKAGAKTLENVLEWCDKAKISTVTLFAFSVQNFKRNQEEKNKIFDLFEDYFSKWKEKKQRKDINVKFLGRLHLFPQKIQNLCKEIESENKEENTKTIQFCFGYGGREEIVDASKALAKDVQEGKVLLEDVNEDTLSNYVYSCLKPDIIIRTGGDMRTSNFLLWQSTYSEWFFIDTLWPAFSKKEFESILNEFQQREQRFGK
ncbi:MAG: polyprenyl diphosphate synthase [Candidatus Nanoarchaeia archaeon]